MMITVVPEWWVFVIAVGLLAILIWLDFTSRAGRLRVWRIVAFILIILSFLGLYMKPYFRTAGDETKIVIRTDSHLPLDLDSLKQLGYRVVDLNSYYELAKTNTISDLIVVGDGLESWELDRMKHRFKYSAPSQIVEGSLEVSTDQAVSNTLTSITFRTYVTDSIDLHLSGAGIETTTKSLEPNQKQITFEINPQVAGDLTYELAGIRGTDTIFSEPVPMKVVDREGFNTLILSSTPSFEIRFLKNLLKEEGYGVAERLQVSKGTFRESFSNLERRSLSRLTKTVLEDFKVIVLDEESHEQLTFSEKQNLDHALKRGSLGIVWMDDTSNDWFTTKSTRSQTFTFKSGQRTVELESRKSASVKNSDQARYQGVVVGHVHDYGLGKVVLPLLQSTYQLKLKGFDRMYSDLWNSILRSIVGFDFAASEIAISDFPRVDEPVTFTFRAIGDQKVYLDSTRLSIEGKWHQPGVVEAVGWPKSMGWNTLRIGDSEHSFFVFDDSDWKAQKVHQKRLQTKMYSNSFTSETVDSQPQEKPISKWIFFIVIVTSLGFLWVEQRVS
ncbi:hypothetical protein [Ekhidna sp.]|uniref:hypothetical protein n=1 Tax=Ekhidna sp. TaxID=2608089 RepID=UPI0035124248